MPNYRRQRVPGASYFFTVSLADRGSSLLTDQIDLVRAAYVEAQRFAPFHCDAFVVLSDHLHAVWTLPEGDADFSTRWRCFKTYVSRHAEAKCGRTWSQARKGEKGLWQRRFWEHRIRDNADHRVHVEYCWFNPVKHGLAAAPGDWPYSSFRRSVQRGEAPDWWVGRDMEGAFGEAA